MIAIFIITLEINFENRKISCGSFSHDIFTLHRSINPLKVLLKKFSELVAGNLIEVYDTFDEHHVVKPNKKH